MSNMVRVADSWRVGMKYCQPWNSHIWTDGKTVWSYHHVIGETNETGAKVAVDCHFSPTTARHCNALKEVADLTIQCIECLIDSDHGKEES